MVIAIIAREILRTAARFGSRYYRVEGQAFNKLYKDFPKGVGRGARHGLTAGSIAGTFINNEADDSPGNVIQKPFSKRQQFTSRKSNQTRFRRTRRNNSRCPEYSRTNNRNRYSRNR